MSLNNSCYSRTHGQNVAFIFVLLFIINIISLLSGKTSRAEVSNSWLTHKPRVGIKSTASLLLDNDNEAAMSYLAPESQQQLKHRNVGSKSQAGKSRSRVGGGNRTATRPRPTVRRIVHPSLYAVWDEYNHLCALARFQATFTIKYETISGTSQLIDRMPANARNRGRCDQFEDEPVIDIMWKDSQLNYYNSNNNQQQQNNTAGFTFRIIFEKYPDDGQWGIQQMQLLYNTGHPVFRGAVNPKKFIVRSNKDDHRLQFRTNLAHSMLCPSPPPIQMYDSNGTMLVIARLANMHLQAFEFSDDRLDIFERCGQVSFGSGVAKHLNTLKNDGLTFAIGTMTVFIATLTVVGYAIYRSNALKTKEYKTMGAN